MTARTSPPRRARRRLIANPRRFATIASVAGASLLAGVVVGALHVPSERRMGAAYAQAWAHRDYGEMYALLSDDARARTTRGRFERAYERAADTLTLERIQTGRVHEDGHGARMDVSFQTRIFGTLRGVIRLPAGDREAGGDGVDWAPELVFPGLRPGEALRRTTVMPPRAAIEARDGSAIAKGPHRTSSPVPPAAPGGGGNR